MPRRPRRWPTGSSAACSCARTSPPSGCCARTTTRPTVGVRTRTGVLARVRVDEYGPGRIRPHERTHPGPKEDRLNLTRATRTNLSPIFSLFPDRDGAAARAMEQVAATEPFASAADLDGTSNTLWRSADEDLVAELQMALADAELLIADGHHRYETARVYADEVGGEGEHRYVLMLLCSLSDPGLLVFPDPPPAHRPQGRHRQAAGDPRRAHARLRDRGAERRPRARAARRAGGLRLHGLVPQAALPRHAQGPGDRRPRARGHARALPAARHGRAGGARPARRARACPRTTSRT